MSITYVAFIWVHHNVHGILLNQVNLHGCQLNGAILDGADLTGADLSEAILGAVSLKNTIFTDANCSKAILSYTHLQGAVFIRTDLRGANLSNSILYDTLMWGIQIDSDTLQTDIAVADNDANIWIQVDGLMTAQLIFLAFDKPNFLDSLNIQVKVGVLVIANFGRRGQVFLEDFMDEALPGVIRALGYCPIILDTSSVDTTQLFKLIGILSSITQYIIVDITELSPVLPEINKILSKFASTKIQVIINDKFYTPNLMENISSYTWIQPLYQYKTRDIITIETVRDIINHLKEREH